MGTFQKIDTHVVESENHVGDHARNSEKENHHAEAEQEARAHRKVNLKGKAK